MEILFGFGLMVGLAVLPFAFLAGMASLALLIWSWGRIGRYFVNLARWLGNWRNFVPLTILGIAIFVVLLVLWRFLLPQLAIVWIVLLVLHLLVTFFCLTFAAIFVVYAFHEWFWPKYKRWLWSIFAFLLGRGWGHSGARPRPGRRRTRQGGEAPPRTAPASQQRPPQKSSMVGSFWALILGKPPQRVKPAAPAHGEAARVQPPREAPTRRSWFGTFWALMLGKPQPKRQQARATSVETGEQAAGPSGTAPAGPGIESGLSERAAPAAHPARKVGSQKRSWFGSFWALIQGKPSKPGQRKTRRQQPGRVDQGERPGRTAPAADSDTGTIRGVAGATAGKKAAKRGISAGIGQRVQEGIEWIRVRLNLD